MIYAEMRREESGDGTHYTLRYLVWNGDLIGSYGVHFGRRGAYGASRDYHQPATPEQVEAYKEQQRFWKLSDDEQDAYEKEHGWPCAQTVSLDGCCYLPDGPSICDGSSLVEIITDNDQRCFEIAAMMADIRETV